MIITKRDLLEDIERYVRDIKNGAVFLHPTDTINGLGAVATHDEAVKKLRRIKRNEDSPMTVIAPSKAWIRQNCIITQDAEKWLGKLPGPYTLILKLKNPNAVSKHVNPKADTLGVRIPNHWISKLVSQIGLPLISTTANVQGEEYKEDLEELHPDIRNNTKFMIYEVGVGSSRPSDIIFLTGDKPRVISRQ
jgi:L-threonylcarbamoyladenylate synthase